MPMAAYKTTQYHHDSDPEDDYLHPTYHSPTLPRSRLHDDDLDDDDDDMTTSAEHTPTTFSHSLSHSLNSSPTGLITQWTADQVADWVAALGLTQYADAFVDEAITGLALVEMQHHDFKEMGIMSVGHRLSLLRGVYDIKIKQNIPLDPDHYDDIARIIESIRLRDSRILSAEIELRTLRDQFERISEENRKLREDTLPVIRMVKDRSQLPPTPADGLGTPPADIKIEKMASGLSRKFSTKKLFLGGAPKNPSPTIHESSTLDPSAAAMAATSHLNPSHPQNSPNQLSQPSPTSPAYTSSAQAMSAGNRSFPRDVPPSARPSYIEDPRQSHVSHAPSTIAPSSRRTAATPVPPQEEPPNSAPLPRSAREKDNPQVEIFKSFRVSIEDPCHKVLPVALQRYNINDDWRQYSLYIVYGDQERCLGLEEKPLMLFKQLEREGGKPMFMLRKHAAPVGEGWSANRTVPASEMQNLGPSRESVRRENADNGRALPGGVL
ncbi:unnamed protein product [Aureobasidium uvarum]|uniref:RA-domain-containing protein n=1 Tax=Aureobasidium uvarum TaxID=2773716 RepID=A0A9N8PX66_9PEZI|nr:unnamed protein product [Aureobasidium uvarum]